MCRILRQQRIAVSQFELAELEPRSDGAADQRIPMFTRHALGCKPAASRDHRLVHRHRIVGRVAQAMRAHRTVFLQHMHIE